MTHIYVVTVGYDYEGEDVDSAWSSQDQALKRKQVLEKQKYGDSLKVRAIPMDNLELLNDDSKFCWDNQYVG